jgi:hypothetical protein
MDIDIPHYLHHAGLPAPYSAQEESHSIDTIDDVRLQDLVWTEFFPAILTAVWLQPGATPTNNGPDRFFEHHCSNWSSPSR